MNKGNFLRTYPVTTYFALTFLISWGGVIALLAPLGMPLTPAQVSGGIFALGIGVMVAGPFLTGLLMTGLVYGKSGFNNLLLKLGKWKVGLQWYAIALLTSPIFVGIILWILSQQSSVFVPRIVSESHTGTLLLSGITVGLAAGVFEEIGWTGFVIPLMRKKAAFCVPAFLSAGSGASGMCL